MINIQDIPQDITHFRMWGNIIRSIQSKAISSKGVAIIEIKIVIDRGNRPVLWTEPQIIKLEPRGKQRDIIELLTQFTDVT